MARPHAIARSRRGELMPKLPRALLELPLTPVQKVGFIYAVDIFQGLRWG
jgi:hypothetical protein